jgi:thiosulfate reductase cytochrome b subunit
MLLRRAPSSDSFSAASRIVSQNGAVLSGTCLGYGFRAMWFLSVETVVWRAVVMRNGRWVRSLDGRARIAHDADAVVRAAVAAAIERMSEETAAAVLRLPVDPPRLDSSRAPHSESIVRSLRG